MADIVGNILSSMDQCHGASSQNVDKSKPVQGAQVSMAEKASKSSKIPEQGKETAAANAVIDRSREMAGNSQGPHKGKSTPSLRVNVKNSAGSSKAKDSTKSKEGKNNGTDKPRSSTSNSKTGEKRMENRPSTSSNSSDPALQSQLQILTSAVAAILPVVRRLEDQALKSDGKTSVSDLNGDDILPYQQDGDVSDEELEDGEVAVIVDP